MESIPQDIDMASPKSPHQPPTYGNLITVLSIDGGGPNEDYKNALLSDICIGTSAAPTYLPAHQFETKDSTGQVKEFHVIDGGVASNNPILKMAEVLSKKKRLREMSSAHGSFKEEDK